MTAVVQNTHTRSGTARHKVRLQNPAQREKRQTGNAFWFNFIPVTLGSIVGAWFLVIPFWLINKDGWLADQKAAGAEPAAKATAIVDGKPTDDEA